MRNVAAIAATRFASTRGHRRIGGWRPLGLRWRRARRRPAPRAHQRLSIASTVIWAPQLHLHFRTMTAEPLKKSLLSRGAARVTVERPQSIVERQRTVVRATETWIQSRRQVELRSEASSHRAPRSCS